MASVTATPKAARSGKTGSLFELSTLTVVSQRIARAGCNRTVMRLPLMCLLLTVSVLAQLPQNIVVTSASSFRVGVPPQGSIGAIFSTGVNISGTVQVDGAPLPWSLAGVSVTVGGAQAPLFSVSGLSGYQQINFQVPQAALVEGYSIPITVTQMAKLVRPWQQPRVMRLRRETSSRCRNLLMALSSTRPITQRLRQPIPPKRAKPSSHT